ncbi:MAG: hypothetical protein WA936_05265 [Erythrobacter sp.]
MHLGKTALLGLAGGVLFIAGYWIGMPNVPPPDGQLEGQEPLVQDAIRRWSLKAATPEKIVRENWTPRAMFIPTHNQGQGMLCIQLQLKSGNLGGSPGYCYEEDFFDKDGTIELVVEYSDAE